MPYDRPKRSTVLRQGSPPSSREYHRRTGHERRCVVWCVLCAVRSISTESHTPHIVHGHVVPTTTVCDFAGGIMYTYTFCLLRHSTLRGTRLAFFLRETHGSRPVDVHVKKLCWGLVPCLGKRYLSFSCVRRLDLLFLCFAPASVCSTMARFCQRSRWSCTAFTRTKVRSATRLAPRKR